MNKFILNSAYAPSRDQHKAINNLVSNLNSGKGDQVLLGVTGSGKTFTMANVIARVQRPTLVISHNKTLAAQLYQEFKEYFPGNAVCYFVSYYDYYQPEAYLPATNTYIEKETEINEEIDKLRLSATANLLTRPDTIIVASVSCIYNLGSPREYGNFVLELTLGMSIDLKQITTRLVQLQYERNDFGFTRGTFRLRGDTIDLYPAYEDFAVRMVISRGRLVALESLNIASGETQRSMPNVVIYPAKHYMTDPRTYQQVFNKIKQDCLLLSEYFKKQGKFIEAQRIRERVEHDLEMIQALGYVNGIENYSRYFDKRKPGDPPYSLLDYYPEAIKKLRADLSPTDWLLFIDESHMTIPQIRGMYHGDRSRKQTLIDYGFRLPAALDNRPLNFGEFLRRKPQTIYVSATPADWELNLAKTNGKNCVVEQLIRPTGLIDPQVIIRPVKGQVADLIKEIESQAARHQRTLVTTLTKRMAEDLSQFLAKRGIHVHYLHSEVLTMERSDILRELRLGNYDVLVGVNLLREGLDLPEVALVAILDADKEGFLRSKTSLMQTMGRAARHLQGKVILYADRLTDSLNAAVEEVQRRRKTQIAYNRKHQITPQGITKAIREPLVTRQAEKSLPEALAENDQAYLEGLTPLDRKAYLKQLTIRMRQASRNLDFELAAKIRDLINQLKA